MTEAIIRRRPVEDEEQRQIILGRISHQIMRDAYKAADEAVDGRRRMRKAVYWMRAHRRE